MRKLAGLAGLLLLLASCGDAETTPNSIRLIAHDSFASGVTEETFAAFTQATGTEVEVIAAGDAGSMVNQAILTKDNPLADVIFGIDDTFLSRALENEILTPFESQYLDTVSDGLILDPTHRATPIDFGDVCINYQKAWFEETALDVPQELDDLRSELYASFLTVEHPATSSPGLAFMLATIEEFGEENWLEFWADLRAAGVRVAPDWDTAYYADFMPYGGSSSMVVSYASSPPAEVIFASEPIDQAPTGVIDVGCYRQVEFAGVLAGTPYPTAAGQLIDFMLSVEFQETIPLTWFVFPANTTTPLPEEFVIHTVLPESPAQMDPERIARNRDRWISQWVSVMEG
ncbi:MAG: thiamine ABC transporter substrate-binding protein [Acidobacteria bacterium]|nr:thiamine ABC transporter substrate-binding protein [Acidobacteriota bacterium]